MHANVGDWLVAQSVRPGRSGRRAQILAVHAGGEAPFTVRWMDNGHEAIMFPGPDSTVVSADEQAELGRAQTARVLALQSSIAAKSS
jgi:hypothetical protein